MKSNGAHRALAATLAVAQLALLVVTVGRAPAAAAAGICSPGAGKDLAGGMLALVNTYYAPANGTTLTAGQATTQITLPAPDTSGGGSAAPAVPAVNDELLIIQMQDGTINTTNSSSYGSVTSLGNAGLYEYVYVSAVAGSLLTLKGAGANGGLINSYVKAAATGSNGQQTFQVVRVPQYTTATLSSNFRAAYWNGKTGGVAALDMASTLNLGGSSIYATGDGFRGAGFTVANSSPAGVLNSDWVDSAAMNGASPPGQGSKAEGVFGTPGNLFYYGTFTTPSAPSGAAVISSTTNGYPGGDMAKGAPGNAGGGGSDIDPASNDQNTGGGGGANGGNGGNGGYPWTSSYTGSTPNYGIDSPGAHTAAGFAPAGASNNPDIGGRGGTSLTPSVTRVFMGGGGGAGSNNNNSNDANNTYGTYGSSGGVGGGIVMLRVADTSGAAATIYANGTTGLAPANDGGGGGGAGGTVIVTSPAAFTGITVNVDGAAGTTAARLASGAGISYQHGPGGGGGGGVALSSSPVAASANGGAAGLTVTDVQANDNYGATAGTSGMSGAVSAAQIPGVLSGAECYVSGGPLYNGPSGADQTVGSYDGSVPVTNNNDFTQAGFNPAGASYINSGITAGAWIGNTIAQGPTTVNVINQFEYFNAAAAKNVTFTITAPTAPAGWTARICPDNGLGTAPSCATTVNWTTVGAAGSASSSIYHVPINTPTSVKYWAVYSAPAGLTAFARYDAAIYATVGAVSNATHNELYPGLLVQTKTATYTPNCGGRAIPPNGVCPGGTITYTIDYRNVAVPTTGGDNEPAAAFAQANGITVTDDGTVTPSGAAQTQNWALPAGGNGYVKAAAVTTGSGTPTVTYYWSLPSLGSSTTFPATTPQKTSVYKIAVTGVSLTAGQNAQVSFTVQF